MVNGGGGGDDDDGLLDNLLDEAVKAIKDHYGMHAIPPENIGVLGL